MEVKALEALPEDLFWQLICLIVVVGAVVGWIISEWKGGGDS